MKFSEQFTAFKYPVNMLPKVQDVLDARGRERGGLNLGRAVRQIFLFLFYGPHSYEAIYLMHFNYSWYGI